jgi:hypothetical protein
MTVLQNCLKVIFMTNSHLIHDKLDTAVKLADASDEVDIAESKLFFTKLQAWSISVLIACLIPLVGARITVSNFSTGLCKQAEGMQYAPSRDGIWKPATTSEIANFCEKNKNEHYWGWFVGLLFIGIPFGLLIRYTWLSSKVKRAETVLNQALDDLDLVKQQVI